MSTVLQTILNSRAGKEESKEDILPKSKWALLSSLLKRGTLKPRQSILDGRPRVEGADPLCFY